MTLGNIVSVTDSDGNSYTIAVADQLGVVGVADLHDGTVLLVCRAKTEEFLKIKNAQPEKQDPTPQFCGLCGKRLERRLAKNCYDMRNGEQKYELVCLTHGCSLNKICQGPCDFGFFDVRSHCRVCGKEQYIW